MMKHTYSDTISDKKIAILGRYPPPLGGISVHIQRVIAKLKMQKNRVYFFETGKRVRFTFFFFYLCRLFFFLMWYRPHRVFYHTMYMKRSLDELKCILFLKNVFGYTITIVDHNCRYLYQRDMGFRIKLNNIMGHIDEQVFIGNLTEKSYARHGIIRPKKWSVQAAFLPPDITQEKAILSTYPQTLFDFYDTHEEIFLVNAFKLCVMTDGKDLYGIDQSLRLLTSLKNEYKKIGLIIAVGEVGDVGYFTALKNLIQKNNLKQDVYFLCGQKELWPLFKKVDLFIRPTLSDGDSVSVREALFFGVPVVASDICIRPDGVIVYKTSNQDDLAQKVKGVLGCIKRIQDPATILSEQSVDDEKSEQQCSSLHKKQTTRHFKSNSISRTTK